MTVDLDRWEPLDRLEFSPGSRAGQGKCSRGGCPRPAEWMRWLLADHGAGRYHTRGLAFCTYHAERDGVTQARRANGRAGILPPDFVYYASRGEQIKIGFSNDVFHRMVALRCTLLASEPGGFRTERDRHRQFAHLRITGEWFRPGPDLLAHIAALTDQAVAS